MKRLLEVLGSILGIAFMISIIVLPFTINRIKHPSPLPKPDTLIVYHLDTLRVHDTLLVPVSRTVTDTVLRIIHVNDTTVVHDTLLRESLNFHKDSLYDITVSGIDPSLDAVTVYPKTTYITIKEPYPVLKSGLSLSVFAGPALNLSVTNQGWKPGFGFSLGAGVSYNF